MNPILAKAFIQRGVIRQGTVLEAYQSAKGLSCVCDSYTEGRYVVLAATTADEWVYFDVVSSAKDRHKLRCDYVTAIDGMAIERVAAAHQLRMDGSQIISGVRRGRKPRLLDESRIPMLRPSDQQQEASQEGDRPFHGSSPPA